MPNLDARTDNAASRTVAESYRDEAERLHQEARVYERLAEQKRAASDAYLKLADKWEADRA